MNVPIVLILVCENVQQTVSQQLNVVNFDPVAMI